MTTGRFRVRTALLAATVLFFGNAQADVVHGQGLLWRITGTDAGEPSYLFGTMHSDDPRVVDLRPAVERAFDNAHRYAFELDFRNDIRAAMQQAMFDRGSPTLREQLDPADWQRARAAAGERGLPEKAVLLMDPWALAITLAVPPVDPQQTLDRILFDRAVERGRPVTGLEKVGEQIDLFDGLATETQLKMLHQVLALHAEERIAPLFDQLREAWLRGDLQALTAIAEANPMLPDEADNDVFERRVIDERNERMVERMQPLVERGGAFVAVGALHLPGDKGMLRLLEQAGYTVEAME